MKENNRRGFPLTGCNKNCIFVRNIFVRVETKASHITFICSLQMSRLCNANPHKVNKCCLYRPNNGPFGITYILLKTQKCLRIFFFLWSKLSVIYCCLRCNTFENVTFICIALWKGLRSKHYLLDLFTLNRNLFMDSHGKTKTLFY